jgi:hypothetical protein
MHSYLLIRKNFSLLVIIKFLYVLVLLSTTSACGPPQKDEAVQAFESWMMAVRMGETKQVWNALSQNTKASLLQKYLSVMKPHLKPDSTHSNTQKTLNASPVVHKKSANQDITHDLAIQLDWSFESPFPQSIKLKSSQALVRSIEFFYAQKKWEIPLVQEEGQWRINLQAAKAI